MFGQLSLPLIVASSVLSAGLAGYAAWTYQAARFQAQISDMQASAAAALRTQEQRYAEQFQRASAAAAARQQGLRLDAERARLAADGLRHDLARAVAIAESSPRTCPDTAAALADVLGAVEGAGRELAATCDRHVNDLRQLTEAWPR